MTTMTMAQMVNMEITFVDVELTGLALGTKAINEISEKDPFQTGMFAMMYSKAMTPPPLEAVPTTGTGAFL